MKNMHKLLSSANIYHGPSNQPSNQRGAALAVGLVLLLAMTVIGISALGTTAMQERMAGNTQELNRAFQISETGLVDAFGGSISLTQMVSGTVSSSAMHASARYDTVFRQFTKPPRGSGYSAVDFSAAHFETDSFGTSDAGASATLQQGSHQITPKP